MNSLVNIFIQALIETVHLTGVIIVGGFILGFLRNNSILNFERSFGMKAVMITGFIGVPVHELSHALAAIIFGHKIVDMKLLQKPDQNGVLGYVTHTYNEANIYQQIGNFFIGVAPIFGGITVIIALMRVTMPAEFTNFMTIMNQNLGITVLNKGSIHEILAYNIAAVKTIFSAVNLKNPYFYLFLFIAICISSHISLSGADMKNAWSGLISIFMIILVINIFGLSRYISNINIVRYNVLMTCFIILAVTFSCITFIISLITRAVRV